MRAVPAIACAGTCTCVIESFVSPKALCRLSIPRVASMLRLIFSCKSLGLSLCDEGDADVEQRVSAAA